MRNATLRNLIINAVSVSCAVILGATLAIVQVNHWKEVRYVEPIVYPSKEVEIIIKDKVVLEQETKVDELALLASMIESEAGNQSFVGKVAVGVTAVNRTSWLNESLTDVITAGGQYVYGSTPSEESIRAAECAMEYGQDLFPAEMMFFRTNHYHDIGEPYERIGDHYFSLVEAK